MVKEVEIKGDNPYPNKSGTDSEPYPNSPGTEKPCTVKSGTKSNSLKSSSSKKKKEEEENAQLNELKFLFTDCFNHMNKSIESRMIYWLSKFPFEVIKNEIERAALNGGKSWNYVETLLIEDEAQNLRSKDDISKKVVSYKEGKKKRTGGRTKALITEMIPEWFDKETPETNVNDNTEGLDSKRKSIEDKLAAFRNR